MNDFRIPLEELEALANAPRSKARSNHFAMIPLEWMREANLLGGSALAVGGILWYRVKLTGDPVTILSNSLAATLGITKKAKLSGLKALVAGGLAKVTYAPGKAPRVIILPVPASALGEGIPAVSPLPASVPAELAKGIEFTSNPSGLDRTTPHDK